MTDELADQGVEETLDGEEMADDLAATNGVAPPPVFERLQKAYEEAGVDRRTTLPIVPGRFGGNLAARYRPVDWERIRRKIKRAARGGMTEEDELNYGASVIAEACETILIRLEDGAALVPLHRAYSKWRDSDPVRFDERLCEAIGINYNPGLNAAAVCRLVFKNPQALNDHFAELDAWLKEAVAGDDEDEDGTEERPT
jgi:hypothetical protein